MVAVDSLRKIRQIWISRVSHRLAKGEGTRQMFQAQLENFFDLLIQAIETGDPSWLNTILDEWVLARTQTDPVLQEITVEPILEQMLLLTYEIASENLEGTEALELIGAVLPVLTYAFGYSIQVETHLHVTQLLQKQEETRVSLERLDKSKSDFISIAAHELKTPLTLIEGYSTMLRDRMKDNNGSSQSLILIKGIENGTRRLRQIVDDMIDVSMIDNQMLALNYQPIWVNRLLGMIQHEFKGTIAERHLGLIVRPFPGSQEMTFGDEERLYQALRNVIANAIKYTPDGGTITVDGRKLPGFVEIIVMDTGIGIDPADHSRIFEKFGRLGEISRHSSGKTKFKGGGPGLGLPITKGILEAHGGAIWVESDGCDEVNCPGSKFHILLPLRKQPPDEKMAKLFRSSLQTGELKDPYR
jgi:signal transduction histidine kinase